MKIRECRLAGIWDFGFIDPYSFHQETIEKFNKDTPDDLLRFLKRQSTKKEILWPYGFK
jgi:hypothetical protein